MKFDFFKLLVWDLMLQALVFHYEPQKLLKSPNLYNLSIQECLDSLGEADEDERRFLRRRRILRVTRLLSSRPILSDRERKIVLPRSRLRSRF